MFISIAECSSVTVDSSGAELSEVVSFVGGGVVVEEVSFVGVVVEEVSFVGGGVVEEVSFVGGGVVVEEVSVGEELEVLFDAAGSPAS